LPLLLTKVKRSSKTPPISTSPNTAGTDTVDTDTEDIVAAGMAAVGVDIIEEDGAASVGLLLLKKTLLF
jgi:hypothetical protein